MEQQEFCINKDSLIAQGVIGDDGTLEFSELYLGEMYVKEITPPEGYTLDTTKYEVSVTYEGQDVAEVTRDLTVKRAGKETGIPVDQSQ